MALNDYRHKKEDDYMKTSKLFALIICMLAFANMAINSLAAQYSDINNKESYMQAINELSSLGIINGYEDGTFRPHDGITRAEAVKLIIKAMNMENAALYQKSESHFSDVPSEHWASGYINLAAGDMGLIEGIGNNMFTPEDNITYAQFIKMLVFAVGYDKSHESQRGYPEWYVNEGRSIGISDDVDMDYNDMLTRKQAAVLLDNAMNIPIKVMTAWSASGMNEYKIMDGKNAPFESLFTGIHEVYKAKGSFSGFDGTDIIDFKIITAQFAENTSEKIIKIKIPANKDVKSHVNKNAYVLLRKSETDDIYETVCLTPIL